MIKAVVGLILVTAIGSSVAWVVNITAEREQLRSDLITVSVANDMNLKSIQTMEESQNKFQTELKKRNELNKKQRANLRRLQGRLNNELSKITNTEKACLTSSMPTPILEFLREGEVSTSD